MKLSLTDSRTDRGIACKKIEIDKKENTADFIICMRAHIDQYKVKLCIHCWLIEFQASSKASLYSKDHNTNTTLVQKQFKSYF